MRERVRANCPEEVEYAECTEVVQPEEPEQEGAGEGGVVVQPDVCLDWGVWSECTTGADGLLMQERFCTSHADLHEKRLCSSNNSTAHCGNWEAWSECVNGAQIRSMSECPEVYETRVCHGESRRRNSPLLTPASRTA